MKNVSNVLTGITDSYTLGLQLDLPSSNLATLASDHPTSLRRMQETVSSWLHYDTEASWSRLARAVEVMGYRDIAETIRRDYCDDSVDGGTGTYTGYTTVVSLVLLQRDVAISKINVCVW